MRTALFIGGSGLALLVLAALLFVVAGPLRTWAHRPVLLRRGHLLALAVALTVPACTAMLVSLAGRIKLDRQIRDSAVTRRDVDRLIVAAAPTTAEQLRKINHALKTCAADAGCRGEFVRTVNRVVRDSSGGLIRPAPHPPAPARPVHPAPPPRTTTVVIKGPRGKQGPPGTIGPPGKPGAAGESAGTLNSALLDGIDNRVDGLEQTVVALTSSVGSLQQRLVVLAEALCRLLPPTC